MRDLWVALGLVLVLEGAVWALFPERMIAFLRQLPELPPAVLRWLGILAVGAGWLMVWLARR